MRQYIRFDTSVEEVVYHEETSQFSVTTVHVPVDNQNPYWQPRKRTTEADHNFCS